MGSWQKITALLRQEHKTNYSIQASGESKQKKRILENAFDTQEDGFQFKPESYPAIVFYRKRAHRKGY